ncbi:hypothetical protein [Lysobacter enzymogenes]|uniref:hypothetical protein n=1 Tax=Lysobacter enzymogenes TaxID=69 RepID=UPI0008992643|nr:hypothetical protein [Lysobacter enzymogenes]SDX52018.1 hypothetical protein SAMN05421681_1062 [Lysobacter enzymogenes]
MTVSAASALIGLALSAGQIDRETAIRAQSAIRGNYYGNRMTNDDRRQLLALRFGIVEV